MLDTVTTEASRLSEAPSATRRGLLRLSVWGGLAALIPAAVAKADEAADAQVRTAPTVPDPALPIVDVRFPAEIAPGVFILPDKRIPLVPNVGIVVGRESVLVVDCGLGPQNGENVIKLARQLAPGRHVVLTVTHAHPEHGFGAQVFKPDGRIYYNAAQRDYFARSGQTLLDGFRAGLSPERKALLVLLSHKAALATQSSGPVPVRCRAGGEHGGRE